MKTVAIEDLHCDCCLGFNKEDLEYVKNIIEGHYQDDNDFKDENTKKRWERVIATWSKNELNRT